MIWRPVMARKVSLTEIKSGVVTIEDLLKLNALMDYELACEHAMRNKPQ